MDSEVLINIIKEEYEFFGKGRFKETDDPHYKRIGEYWKDGAAIDNINGRTKDSEGRNPAWSAAFISWVIRKAGGGGDFRYGAAHCHYIVQAIRDRKSGKEAHYHAYDFDEYAPQVGDIICVGRSYDKKLTFDNAEMRYISDEWFPSHGDIVVGRNQKGNRLLAVGGNLSNSVKRKSFLLEGNGKLSPKTGIAILRLMPF